MIQNDQLKKSTLDDNAEIYNRRVNQTEKEKLRNMSFHEKLTYFNNYYKNKVLFTIAILTFIIALFYNIFAPKTNTVLYTAIINNTIGEEEIINLKDQFADVLSTNPKKEKIVIDTSLAFNDKNIDQSYAMASQQKLTAQLGVSEIDVIIAPESIFYKYAKEGLFVKLSDQFTTEMFTYFTDSYYLSKPEETDIEGAYGIYLEDSSIYKNSKVSGDRPVLGIVANSKHKENAVEFIKYIFNLN